MAGIYIHIPFCKKRCSYCDFYTEVAPRYIPGLVDSIVKELHVRKGYLNGASIKTIYFGGGTPSILKPDEFSRVFETINSLFEVEKDAEITLEANPDDLKPTYLQSIRNLPFNRISIGIQSFDDNDLKRINRRHSGLEARKAVGNARAAGFDNISIDLIYGLPSQTMENWQKQLDTAFNLGIQHISAYGLTYEEGTELWKQREKGEVEPVDEETMNQMYLLLVEEAIKHGFETYEISNLSLPGYNSRHNSSYWKQEPYLGIGPSAHSYDLHSRQWNVSSITAYIDALKNSTPFSEKEELSLYDRYNDYVMVSLRTSEGIDTAILASDFGSELTGYLLENIEPFLSAGKVQLAEGKIRLTMEGILVSNLILVDILKV